MSEVFVQSGAARTGFPLEEGEHLCHWRDLVEHPTKVYMWKVV